MNPAVLQINFSETHFELWASRQNNRSNIKRMEGINIIRHH